MDSARTALQAGAVRLEVQGILRYVNTFARELGVQVEGAALALDVPIDCPIYLREERVKLRFLQPGDHVQITCSQSADGLVGESICVNWTSLVSHKHD